MQHDVLSKPESKAGFVLGGPAFREAWQGAPVSGELSQSFTSDGASELSCALLCVLAITLGNTDRQYNISGRVLGFVRGAGNKQTREKSAARTQTSCGAALDVRELRPRARWLYF